MSTPHRPSILNHLAPEVVAFKRRSFALCNDLERLDKVRQVKAHEATVLYCGRILEALASAALELLDLPRSNLVITNLEVLEKFHLLPPPTHYWAHGLRRLGNDARHLRRRLRHRDAQTALLFLERWLRWFFCCFAGQPRPLPCLTRDGQPLAWAGRDLLPLVEALEAADLQTPAVVELASAQVDQAAFRRTPTLAAVLAEVLLDRDELQAAKAVLTVALQEFPRDLRLRQLLGLSHSRTGDLEQARQILLPLQRDDETAGILAGVYKRQWHKDPTDRKSLTHCHRAYRKGWQRSRQSNAYLGINAATTALWLGRPEEARVLAEEVRGLMQSRADAVDGQTRSQPLALGYWDHVTLAEAQLVLGDPDAFPTYRSAFGRHASLLKSIDVSRQQARRILEALGRSAEVADLP